jgi:hypothetical protein
VSYCSCATDCALACNLSNTYAYVHDLYDTSYLYAQLACERRVSFLFGNVLPVSLPESVEVIQDEESGEKPSALFNTSRQASQSPRKKCMRSIAWILNVAIEVFHDSTLERSRVERVLPVKFRGEEVRGQKTGSGILRTEANYCSKPCPNRLRTRRV